MTNKEEQEEEREVLLSIYDGDECFKTLSDSSYQYRVGDDGDSKSFLLEISWSENYPEELPNINLNAFYNNHILNAVKESIASRVTEEAEQWIGSAMTYTLFEWAKENAESLMENQKEIVIEQMAEVPLKESTNNHEAPEKKQKKEQLTKAQKRKITNRTDYKGERERGWNWVDVIKHLNKTADN